MARKIIEIILRGGVSPETVNVDELMAVIGELQLALFEMARSEGVALDGPYFSLVGISEGSHLSQVALSESAVVPMRIISGAVAERGSTSLPRAVQEKLHKIDSYARRKSWSFHVQGKQGLEDIRFEISRANPISKPKPPSKIAGQTTTYGKCLWVNGDKKQAGFDLLGHGTPRLVVNVPTEELIIRLGTGMYEVWRLEGKATWDAETWKITSLVLSDAVLLNPDNDNLFERLAKSSEGQWDDVNAVSFVGDLRAGE